MSGVDTRIDWMTHQRTLSVIVVAYVYAALVVAGPWIFTMLGIFGLSSSGCSFSCDELALFRSIVIYNSLFSLVVTSPLAFLSGRYVSDRLYMGETGSVFYSFVASLAVFSFVTLCVAVPFYLLATDIDGTTRIAAVQNAFLIGASWLLLPFLATLRAHRTLLVAFGCNALTMMLVGTQQSDMSAVSLILTFNVGFAITDIILIWGLVTRVGTDIEAKNGLFDFTLRHPELPAAGAAYAIGIWVDKVIMWIAAPPGSLSMGGVLKTMPSYDTAMFWAQLASIPVIAVAFVHIEPRLNELLQQFYGRLGEHLSLRELRATMQKVRACVISSIATLFVALGIVATLTILLSFVFMNELGLKPSYMSILRIAAWAMAFQTSCLFCFVFLLYFDLRRQALITVLTYVILNACLTLAFLPLGQPFYGYGTMIAAAIAFLVGFALLLRELPWLHYHAFITNNTSL